MRRMIATGALALLLAVPAQAQQNAQRHMMGQGQMHDGMGMMQGGMSMMQGGMGMMMMSGLPTPGMILRAGEELNLTEDQQNRLEAMQTDLAGTIGPQMQAAMAAHEQATAALQADPVDIDAYRSALETAMEQMVQVHVAQARAGLEARELLTATQREKLESAAGMMNGMMGGMMGGGMMGHGMGGGMMEHGTTGGGMIHGRGPGGH